MITLRNDITKVKEINVELIKSALKSLGSATKAEIAGTTGISVATCNNILNELCASGEVTEVSVLQNGYGRPAKCYSYNAGFAYVACIYVAAEQKSITLSTVVSNLLGEVIEEQMTDIPLVDEQLIKNTVEALLHQHSKIKSISIGIPGYITGNRIGLCNFPKLISIPLLEHMRAEFPDVKFCIENDMNAAAYGFYQSFRKGEETTIAFISAPERPPEASIFIDDIAPDIERLLSIAVHIGAGFVSEGRILHGFSGFSGEVAFLPALRNTLQSAAVLTPQVLADIICSVVPILNPEVIALTGSFFPSENFSAIFSLCQQQIVPQHMPTILLRKDIHSDYINGLTTLALEQLSCDVVLISKYPQNHS